MIKKALLVVGGLGATTLVLFGRDAASYVGTTYHRVTSSVKESVPVEFQIDRAREMVRDLEPEIRRSMHVIAKEEVALEQLNQQIDDNGRQDGQGQARHSAPASRPGQEQGHLPLREPQLHGRRSEAGPFPPVQSLQGVRRHAGQHEEHARCPRRRISTRPSKSWRP